MYLRTTDPQLARPYLVPWGGSLVSKKVMILVVTLFAFIALGFFRFFLMSGWTNVGAVVIIVGAGIWLSMNWSSTQRVWIGLIPLLGILGAVIMAGPLIEDVILKALHDDPIPAIILVTYMVIGAGVYLFYGLPNSRLAQGKDILDDSPTPKSA